MGEVAKIELNGEIFEFPIVIGSEGEKGIDITSLRATTGFVTLDNGFMNTGSCRSAITFLNGEKGILRYRGYPIEQLCEKSHFQEVASLLIEGELPTEKNLELFKEQVGMNVELPQGVENIIDTFPARAHPMGVVASGIASLSAFYPELIAGDLSAIKQAKIISQILGQAKVMAARFYRRSLGLIPVKSRPELGYAGDFMNMMFSAPGYSVPPEVNKALDVLLILHADHEQNCSTSTVRVVGSSQANVFAAISSGIDALWGQLHGGANQAVLEMLLQIQKAGGDYKEFLAKAKDKNDSFRLMGFGHRVYKNFDPRAQIIKGHCDSVLETLGVQDELLDIAKGLEVEALKDEYFVERKLYPNVDFYSGIIYRALGIPTDMFTVMFVLGRLPGWLAQWKEMIETPGNKIARPRQIYTGFNKRDYVDIKAR